MTERDDAELMGAVAAGDRQAYAVLVGRYLDSALRIAERMTGRRADAEDAVQDAFLKLWRKAHRFDANKARFRSWFYRIVANAAIDRHRKWRHAALPHDFEAVDPASGAEQRAADADRGRVLRQALATLPDRQRLAVTLCYLEGLSNVEAAAVLGIGVKAIESLLVRARRSLGRALGDRKEDLL